MSDKEIGKALARLIDTFTGAVAAAGAQRVPAARRAPAKKPGRPAKQVQAKAKAKAKAPKAKIGRSVGKAGNGAGELSQGQAAILAALQKQKGEYITGAMLAEAAGLAAASVSIAVKKLREHGHKIEGKRGAVGGGYCLQS